MVALSPELDIVVWAVKAPSASEASRLADTLFNAAAAENLHMAKANIPRAILESHWPQLIWDQQYVTCLRSCLMKPEHLEWMDRIWQALDDAARAMLQAR